MINITAKANRILNIVKAKHGLRTKSEAINVMAREYEVQNLELELRPEYKRKLEKIIKGKHLSRKEFEKLVN